MEPGSSPKTFSPILEGLLALYPIETLDEHNRPQATDAGEAVTVTKITPSVYRGTVEVDHAGGWAIVPFPGANGFPEGLYETTPFTVPDLQSQPLQLVVAMGATLVVGTAITVVARRRVSV